jgi:hypothetical protein
MTSWRVFGRVVVLQHGNFHEKSNENLLLGEQKSLLFEAFPLKDTLLYYPLNNNSIIVINLYVYMQNN